MTITIFALFVAYTLCCIADGPDVKPIIKRRLSKYLEVQANRLHPIQYVHPVVRQSRDSRLENVVRFGEDEVLGTMRRKHCSPEMAVRLITEDSKSYLAKSIAKTLLDGGFVEFKTDRDFTGAFYVRAIYYAAKY